MVMFLSGFIVFTLALAGFVPSAIAGAPPCALLSLADVQRVLGGGFEPPLAAPTMCARTPATRAVTRSCWDWWAAWAAPRRH
jgi:hypothetical protein